MSRDLSTVAPRLVADLRIVARICERSRSGSMHGNFVQKCRATRMSPSKRSQGCAGMRFDGSRSGDRISFEIRTFPVPIPSRMPVATFARSSHASNRHWIVIRELDWKVRLQGIGPMYGFEEGGGRGRVRPPGWGVVRTGRPGSRRMPGAVRPGCSSRTARAAPPVR